MPSPHSLPQSLRGTESVWVPRVWAPDATKVELVLGSAPTGDPNIELRTETEVTADRSFAGEVRRETMEPGENGWWEATAPLSRGTRYGFSLDGGHPRPDPRSRFQPQGVHSWSQVWLPGTPDHGSWAGLDCLDKVFYELHVGTFTPEGTFAAAAGKLGYLKETGVEVIELLPLAAFEGSRGWGYDQVLPFAVESAYGTPDDLAEFVAAAHREGLAVCLDIVLNHFGNFGCYLGEFGPYFHAEQTMWGGAFDLDQPGEPLEYLADAAWWWLEAFGIDALRLDAIHAIEENGRKRLMDAVGQRVRRLEETSGWQRTLIAESDLNQVSLLDKLGLDGLWNDDFHHALHTLLTGESQGYYADFATPKALVKVMADTYFHNGTFSSFRNQVWGETVDPGLDRAHFVVCASNHDQVGNRPFGDRPASYIPEANTAALATLTLLSPFTPLLFMGEEFGAVTPFAFFCHPLQEDDAQKVRDGRLREFAAAWENTPGEPDREGPGRTIADGKTTNKPTVTPPDPTAETTFEDSKLDWPAAQSPRGRAFRRWHRDLIELRHRAGAGDFLPEPLRGSEALPAPYRGEATWNGQVLVMSCRGLEVWVNFGPPVEVSADTVLNWDDYAIVSGAERPDSSPSHGVPRVTQVMVRATR